DALSPHPPIPIAPGLVERWRRRLPFQKTADHVLVIEFALEVALARPPMIQLHRGRARRSARRTGARLGLLDRRSSSQHLIVGIHARSVTRAQALPTVKCGR